MINRFKDGFGRVSSGGNNQLIPGSGHGNKQLAESPLLMLLLLIGVGDAGRKAWEAGSSETRQRDNFEFKTLDPVVRSIFYLLCRTAVIVTEFLDRDMCLAISVFTLRASVLELTAIARPHADR